MLIWHAWARTVPDPAEELARRLQTGGPDALPAADALLRVTEPGQARATVAHVEDDALRDTYKLLGVLLAQAVRARDAVRSQLAREEGNAARRIAEQLSRPFLALEGVVYGYFRLRAILADAGWRQIAPTLGDSLVHEDLDPTRYEVRGDGDAARFVVRSLGIEIEDEPVVRAIVEGLEHE